MIGGRDIVLLAFLSTAQDNQWTIRALASELKLSPASVQRSIRNLVDAGLLFDRPERKFLVSFETTRNFFVNAASSIRPYFPPKYGGDGIRGVATAWSEPSLRDLLVGVEMPVVWPHELGQQRGMAISPLHESVAGIALTHPDSGHLLAMVDAIRYGVGPRVPQLASELIAEGFEIRASIE